MSLSFVTALVSYYDTISFRCMVWSAWMTIARDWSVVTVHHSDCHCSVALRMHVMCDHQAAQQATQWPFSGMIICSEYILKIWAQIHVHLKSDLIFQIYAHICGRLGFQICGGHIVCICDSICAVPIV